MSAYKDRFYRSKSACPYHLEVTYKETDMYFQCDKALDKSEVKAIIKKYYDQIAGYIHHNRRFFSSLSALPEDNNAPPIVQDMLSASQMSGIGPFSAVAGAMNWYVGGVLAEASGEIIIENGGDLYLNIHSEKKIGVYLGPQWSPQSLTLRITHRGGPFGICSSSATISHSLNFGRADLVTVVAETSLIADTFATALSNKIKSVQDIEGVLKEAQVNPHIEGILIACEQKIALWGEVAIDV
jgi:ApbE superfamily uncharacterized protein (UPF0280 family)